MCGIAGFCDFNKKVDKNTLINMTDTLHHRGPDDSGYSFYENEYANIGLGHRRLSILDLSTHGHQPMAYETLETVYNGEVYNFKEIREELEKYNYTFDSDSDTEVILKAYHKWGIKAVDKFNGMFAISIYNKKENKLIIIRDRIGKKPLYYSLHNNSFLFASELKALMKYQSFDKTIDKEALNMFLYHGYIAAPHSIFEYTKKLQPGSYLELDLVTKKINIETYWSIKNTYEDKKLNNDNIEKNIDTLDSLLTKSISYRMISDVSIGSFLSGGYDSSLVTAVMQKISDKPISTFTIGFNEKDFNEANYAKEVAKYLGTNHHELYLPIRKSEELISQIPIYYDEPFADSSQIPTMFVSKLAKENVTVALSGDGGDELFCGYGRYETILKYQKFKNISKFYNILDSVLPLNKVVSKIDRKLVKLGYLNNDNNIVNFGYLYSEFYLNGLVKNSNYTHYNQKYFDIMNISNNIQEKHMLQDMITYLPDDIMVKVDRASMAYSLEARSPLLDHNIVEFSMNLPHKFKYNNGNKKDILKQLTHRYIPKNIMDRPKKGFGIPIYKWLHNDLNYLVKKYLNKEYILKQDIFDYNQIRVILNGFSKEYGDGYFEKFIWHILVFQLWYEEYIA
jgi:asparagine synthase (glutamine-hydrolysing)